MGVCVVFHKMPLLYMLNWNPVKLLDNILHSVVTCAEHEESIIMCTCDVYRVGVEYDVKFPESFNHNSYVCGVLHA